MAGVNGVEIKVGQVWRCWDGVEREIDNVGKGAATTRHFAAGCIHNEMTYHGNLIELVKDENGFTIWRGGEQQPEDTRGTFVEVYSRTADGLLIAMADDIKRWERVVRYKVVEQAEAPQPADSAALAEETLSALGWTFDGQAWIEQPTIGMVPNALDVQVGGTHYKDCAIQPIEYIHANKLGFAEGNVVKYITRHRQKHGAADVKKAMHYCQLLLELEYGANTTSEPTNG